MLFWAHETQLYEKWHPWSFLFCCLFKLYKHEKTPSSSFIRLVKTWWHRIPSEWRFTSISYPVKLVKNHWGTHQKWWGKWTSNYCRVGSMSLLNMALVCFRVWVVTSHLVFTLTSVGLGDPVLTSHLLIASSPWPLIRWCQILPSPLSCHQYVQEKLTYVELQPPSDTSHNSNSPQHSSSVSCQWCGKHYGPPWSRSLPVDFSSLSRKLI